MKISIIIPVYNVEQYIRPCISSILNQNYDDYEIIIIDDGSKDKSIEILEPIIEGKYNIHLIRQENKGLSAARNKGLSIAKGDYVWFIDSDDWIAEDSLRHISLNIKKQDIIVIGGASLQYYERYGKPQNLAISKTSTFTGKGCFYNSLVQISCAPYAIFNRVFLLTNNLLFKEGIYHEDNEFLPRVFYFAKQVTFVPQTFYFHRTVPTSITHTINYKRGFDCLLVANSLYEFYLKNVFEKKIKHFFIQIISMMINSALDILHSSDASTMEQFNIYMKKNPHLLRCFLKSHRLKYIIEGMTLIYSSNYIANYNKILHFRVQMKRYLHIR